MTGKARVLVAVAAASCLVSLNWSGSAGLAQPVAAAPGSAAEAEFSLPQSDYVEHCGGCHGVQGNSAPAAVPVLRDRIGWFLCTPKSRAYLIHLPNVAYSRITDNAQLADLVNFTVFGLGGASVPRDAKPFTAEEVARERLYPLTSTSLKAMRVTLVEDLIRKCGAPKSLRSLYPAQKAG